MPKFRPWEWVALGAAGLILSIAAPVSDYRKDLAAEFVRWLPLLLVSFWATSKCIALALRRQWRPAATCLSIAIAAAMLFYAGQAIGDYLEVHRASHSLSTAIDRNYRHVAAEKIYGDRAGYVSYVVFDPADANAPVDSRTIGDHFFLVNGVLKPCR